jgi:hypothetical protein
MYRLQFSLQAASPETFGYTLINRLVFYEITNCNPVCRYVEKVENSQIKKTKLNTVTDETSVFEVTEDKSFEAFTAVMFQVEVFWVVTRCSVVV